MRGGQRESGFDVALAIADFELIFPDNPQTSEAVLRGADQQAADYKASGSVNLSVKCSGCFTAALKLGYRWLKGGLR